LSSLEAASARASELDRELAGWLDRPAPPAPRPSAGYLRELEGRERLSPASELALVRAAQGGNAGGLGMSAEGVRRVESRALGKLRAAVG
jgi:hypothetical protein